METRNPTEANLFIGKAKLLPIDLRDLLRGVVANARRSRETVRGRPIEVACVEKPREAIIDSIERTADDRRDVG